jgi:tripartite-type tricarboxylate transporter receptor subunit TctC
MKHSTLRRQLLALCIAPCLALSAGLCAAQTYPSKAIKIVVPFPPGGSADLLARSLGERLTASMGQPVLIDNKPGAGGIAGADFVNKSPADGHTLLFANTNIAINPSLYPKLPYDTAKAFEPVILLATVPSLILVPAKSPANNLQELIAMAKARPGALNYGSAGGGTFPHLAIEMLKAQAGITVTHIPYKGAAPALNALLAEDIQLLCNDMLTGTQQVKAGKVKALGYTGATRSPILPQVPTVAEAGLKDYLSVGWQGIMVPAGTPPAIIERLNAEFNKALQDPNLRQNLTSQGLVLEGGSTKAFGDYLREDTERWRAVVKTSGATPD